MSSKYRELTTDELRLYVRKKQVIVWGATRKGRGSKMPLVPANMRFPGKKVPLLRGIVDAVSSDGARCKLNDERGPSHWVDCADLLFYPEKID